MKINITDEESMRFVEEFIYDLEIDEMDKLFARHISQYYNPKSFFPNTLKELNKKTRL